MNNPAYTDDQIETAIAGTTFPNRLAEMLAYVYADRQRLQAEVESLRSELHDANDAYASILKELHSIKGGEQ